MRYQEVLNKLARLGFKMKHGKNHVVLQRGKRTVTVPRHRKIKTGTLHSILRQAGVSIEEFEEA